MILSRATEPKMSKSQKCPKNPIFYFFNFSFLNRFLSIFSAKHIYYLSSKFFSAPKKDILEEIKFGHLWFFKNVQNQKVILSSIKRVGIRHDRLFQVFFNVFYLHNVGILMFCRRRHSKYSTLQECRDNCLISYPPWSFPVKNQRDPHSTALPVDIQHNLEFLLDIRRLNNQTNSVYL